mmetsp:Transcript_5355/g.3779  ORF Transcript_5355/g.3779 Transcript_5355/m.3779 type:complete len:136 (+) Transcript_5355:666-1073(+)
MLYICQMYCEKLESNVDFLPSSISFTIGGTFALFVSWLFFNSGSGFTVTADKDSILPAKIVTNTILAASSSALSSVVYRKCFANEKDKTNKYSPLTLCSTLLAGLVSVTASCNNVETWAAVVIGNLGCVVYFISL